MHARIDDASRAVCIVYEGGAGARRVLARYVSTTKQCRRNWIFREDYDLGTAAGPSHFRFTRRLPSAASVINNDFGDRRIFNEARSQSKDERAMESDQSR